MKKREEKTVLKRSVETKLIIVVSCIVYNVFRISRGEDTGREAVGRRHFL